MEQMADYFWQVFSEKKINDANVYLVQELIQRYGPPPCETREQFDVWFEAAVADGRSDGT